MCIDDPRVIHKKMKNIFTTYLVVILTILSLSGCKNSSHVADNKSSVNLDVIDPNTFNAREYTKAVNEEIKAYERSKKELAYYSVVGKLIHYRAISYTPKSINNIDEYDWFTDIKGQRVLVSKKIELDQDDIEGILIEKVIYQGKEARHITIYFKREAWEKVFDVTSRYASGKSAPTKRLGIVKNNKLFTPKMVIEAYSNKDSFGAFSESDTQWLVSGFMLAEKPSFESREEEYRKWLKQNK